VTGPRLLLLVGILATGGAVEAGYHVRGHIGVGPLGWRLFRGKFFGPHHVFEEKRELALQAGALVAVKNAFGDVAIGAGEAGRVEIRLRKDVYLGAESEARAFAERIELHIEQAGGRLRVGTNREELEHEGDAFDVGFETHFELRVPPGTAVEVTGAHGRVDVEDAGAASVDNSYGDVRASRVASARVVSRHGRVELLGVAGDIQVDARHGDVALRDAAGCARVVSEHGKVSAERTGALAVELKHGDLKAGEVRGDLHVRAEHAGVEARGVAGGADVESSFDDSRLEEVDGDARVSVTHGGIRLFRVKGSVVAESSFADTTLEDVSGRAEVNVTHGGLRAKRLHGGLLAHTEGDGIVLDGFRGRVEAESQRGGVELTPDGPLRSPVDARASFGNVQLRVPAGSSFELLAEVDGGELRVALPGLQLSERSEERLSGRVGAGGPRVALRAQHGDVKLADSFTEVGTRKDTGE
jgi:hypothetical protein